AASATGDEGRAGAVVEAARPRRCAARCAPGRRGWPIPEGLAPDVGGGPAAASLDHRRGRQSAEAVWHGRVPMVTAQREALFRPGIGPRPVLKGWYGLPLFWRLLGVNLVVVLGGA